MKMRRTARIEHYSLGAQMAFARAATGLGVIGLGALAVGASAVGAVAISALAIRAIAVKRGRTENLEIEGWRLAGCASGSYLLSRSSKLLHRRGIVMGQ